MEEHAFSVKALLVATLNRFLPFLALVGLIVVACGAIYVWRGSLALLPLAVAAFFTLLYFSAPIALSYLKFQHGVGSFDRGGRKVLAFCFLWGALVIALFVATLQLWQGMDATMFNYAYATGFAGVVCAAASLIPNRQRF
jgi:hypothetical protein